MVDNREQIPVTMTIEHEFTTILTNNADNHEARWAKSYSPLSASLNIMWTSLTVTER